eukprot:g10972.t1
MSIFFQVVCVCLLMAVIVGSQELQNCSIDAIPLTIGSIEDADALAASLLACADEDFAVQWTGEVLIPQAIRVTGGNSLHITGAGPGAIVDGGGKTRLFHVDEGSTLHVSDMTLANGNASSGDGGAIFVNRSTVSFGGSMSFISNSADGNGGAISAFDSTLSWEGDRTEFSNNSAGIDGGAVFASVSAVSFDRNTSFRGNVAGASGGALALVDLDQSTEFGPVDGTVFIENSAGYAGGATSLLNCETSIEFVGVTFRSNSALGSGGAIGAFASGPASFSGCTFQDNKADYFGGAIEVLVEQQEFVSCEFVGNSADVGGAMRLGGSAVVINCTFVSNSATSRGLAVNVVGLADITNSSFNRNELYCEAGSYRGDIEEEGVTGRFETVCFNCFDWNECVGCTIEAGGITPTCEAPLEHTTASEPGVTLETLNISRGYWRATNMSDNILACYNAGACSGGVTGSASYCAPGYTGPYCAVCETGFSTSPGHTCTRCSSSRRHGLMAAMIIAALVALVALATISKYLMTTKVEEKNMGWFHRRVLRTIPVQALKIVVVVWQILTQFAEAASVSYPGVYQDFLNVIDFINFDVGSVLAAGCVWPDIDFHDRLVVSTAGPLVVIGLLALTYRIAVRNSDAPSDGRVVEEIFHKHLTALLLLTFLVYSSVSSMLFQTFACETLDDGIEYLRADYRINCTDAKHKAFEVYAGIMVFVYPVGIPLFYAALLFQHRDALAHADADKTAAESISGLWEPYTPDRFYYEVVECGRRVMLTGVVVFIFPNDAAQIAITILIAFFFFAIFESLSPYGSGTDMWLSRGGHTIVFLSMFDLLLLKVDVSGERDQSQAAFEAVLLTGHVLMILAIFVEVIGIYYASGTNEEVIKTAAGPSGLRPRVGSDDIPVFESAPASRLSFMHRER